MQHAFINVFAFLTALGAVLFNKECLSFFTEADTQPYFLNHIGSAVYVAVSAYLVLYFYWWCEDPKKATPSMFPRVLNDTPNDVRIGQTTPFSNTEGKYLVIGAGFVGLGMAGGLQRHELPFDMVEKEDNIGGNWRYGVYDTVHIISSKSTTEFKDFPMPNDFPDFPSCGQMREYLESYANHYHINERLVCGASVQSCVPVGDGSGGWDVTLTVNPTGTSAKGARSGLRGGVSSSGQKDFARNNNVYAALSAAENSDTASVRSGVNSSINSGNATGITITRRYKGVVVSLGHHWAMRMPNIVGIDKFKGKLVHSKQVWSPSQELAGKRVLVIGGGNSACDLATEAGKHGAHCSISMRRGVWFIPRTFMGRPTIELGQHWAPLWLQRVIIRAVCRITFGNYKTNYGLQEPTIAPLDTHPVINNDLLQGIKMGRVNPKPGIKRVVSGTTVEFSDGTTGEFDMIVAATGYKYAVPMLAPEILTYKDGIPELYGGMATANYRHLYVTVGGQVRYGAGPIISIGGQSLGHAIKAQEQVKHPIGAIFRAVGEKKLEKSPHCSDALADASEMWAKGRKSPRFFGFLPTVEKILIRLGKLPAEAPEPKDSLGSPARDRSASPGGASPDRPRWKNATRGGIWTH